MSTRLALPNRLMSIALQYGIPLEKLGDLLAGEIKSNQPLTNTYNLLLEAIFAFSKKPMSHS